MNGMIERQAAIDALARTAREKFNLSDEYSHYLAGLMDGELAIKNLPSVEPKHGRRIEFSPKAIYECSLCHKYVATANIEADHFCPYCGAKMEADHE